MSYHTPSHVQAADATPRRLRAALESAASWRRMANRTTADGVLFGGDDNVDEASGAYMGRLRPFLDRYTGLTQVEAPAGTHGRRRIDDFRVRGLIPLEGSVRAGGGDHRIHVREFRWPA